LPTVPDSARVELRCSTALRTAIEADGPGAVPVAPPLDRCAKPAPTARGVGDPCTPDVRPAAGFEGSTAYVQVRAMDCESNACLVDSLGDTDCDDNVCVADQSFARLYCSCRCDAADGDDGNICDCPEGFVCEDVLASGPDGVRGGYCRRAL
jgi:hypothetical protein